MSTSDHEVSDSYTACDNMQSSDLNLQSNGKFSSMFDKDMKLIKAVRNLPVIYDHKAYSPYKFKHKKNEAWKMISCETLCSADECRMRWRTLRERFARERKHKLGKSTWPLYDEIKFISPFVKPRNRLYQKKPKYEDDKDMKAYIYSNNSDRSDSSYHDFYPMITKWENSQNTTYFKGSSNDEDYLMEDQSDNNSDQTMANGEITDGCEQSEKRSPKKIRTSVDDNDFCPNTDDKCNSSDDQTLNYHYTNRAKHFLSDDIMSNVDSEDLLFGQSVAAELSLITNRKSKIKLKADIFRLLSEATSEES